MDKTSRADDKNQAPLPGELPAEDERALARLAGAATLIAEQALSGRGLDADTREMLALAPQSAAAQQFRSSLTAAVAELACAMAESDPEGAASALREAFDALGPRASSLASRSRPLSEAAAAFPGLAFLAAESRSGLPPSRLAAKALARRASKRASALAAEAEAPGSELDDILGGFEDVEPAAPKASLGM